jgi:hypothetical protein
MSSVQPTINQEEYAANIFHVTRHMTLPDGQLEKTQFHIEAHNANDAIATAHKLHVPHSSEYLKCHFVVA